MKNLSTGTFDVKITSVTTGISEFKKTPYLLVRFENSDGFFEQRIYQAGNYMKLLKLLYSKAGVNTVNYDGLDLVGCKLCIDLTVETRTINNGETISYPSLNKYYSLYERQDTEVVNDDAMDEDITECTDIGDYAEIFGVNIKKLAQDLDLDVSQLTPGLIMESVGY